MTGTHSSGQWFNSKIRAEPYQHFIARRDFKRRFRFGRTKHRCCMAVVSSCRDVGLSPATSATPILVAIIKLGTERTASDKLEEGGMTSSPHGPYVLATHVLQWYHNRKQNREVTNPDTSVRIAPQLEYEAELLVIDQRATVNAPGLAHPPVTPWELVLPKALKTWPRYSQRLGWSNKVAVGELRLDYLLLWWMKVKFHSK